MTFSKLEHDDFLVEIQTEELPPKSLLTLAEAFRLQLVAQLEKANLAFKASHYFATPRRLAVYVTELAATQPDQVVERKGPALAVAFDANGNPSPACVGFAKSCGVTAKELQTIKTEQGEWVGFQQQVQGKSVIELLPAMVEQALAALPISKRMRWGASDVQFVRPVHSVIMLYGDTIVPANILGCAAGRTTSGHRFHATEIIPIPHAAEYEELLKTKGHVIVDVEKRRELIKQLAHDCMNGVDLSDTELLNEVTGLVEWPVAFCGTFDNEFLQLPREILITSMKDHQRYFPVINPNDTTTLLPHFVTISNIYSKDPERVVHGNERVLRARLSDAAFFYAEDKKESLTKRIDRLKGIVFQAKLGTLYDKAERVSQLAVFIADQIGADTGHTKAAAMLAKTDLTTNLVGEFPELQGVMGSYYAAHDGLSNDIVVAMREQYLPRFAGDSLPVSRVGLALALADRIDTLVGAFSINQIPTGDKDPYGLRRAALGVLRIIIETKLDLDLKVLIANALTHFPATSENKAMTSQIVTFMQERLRAWYQDQGITPDVFAAVAALNITNPLDADERIKAVQAFKKLTEAGALSAANKRVSNILAKETVMSDGLIQSVLFEHDAERVLAEQVDKQHKTIATLVAAKRYDQVLLQLSTLRQPVDDFFDQVMVMTDDKPKRDNRILLLNKLRGLFLQVADIALLQ
jgi:glycyl-tRNA synthetase beta chain